MERRRVSPRSIEPQSPTPTLTSYFAVPRLVRSLSRLSGCLSPRLRLFRIHTFHDAAHAMYPIVVEAKRIPSTKPLGRHQEIEFKQTIQQEGTVAYGTSGRGYYMLCYAPGGE